MLLLVARWVVLQQDEDGDPDTDLKKASNSGLWNEPSTQPRAAASPQGAGLYLLGPAVTEFEHSHAYLGVLAQGSLEKAGF